MHKNGAWTKEELDMLHGLYPYKRSVDVAAIIGRSKSAVDHMATRLKIQKDSASLFQIRSSAKAGCNTWNFHNYRRATSKGYVALYRPSHPNASKDGLVLEHRLVMADYLGRPIRSDEAIHHINGNKADNRIENLRLMGFGEHSTFHNKRRKKLCNASS